jgi:hypothetical protein
MHARSLLFFLCLAGIVANAAGDEKFKVVFSRDIKPGQLFRCEAKADYLAEYYLSGSIKSAKVSLNSIQVEVHGLITVVEAVQAQPSTLEIKIENFSGLENGAKHQSDLAGKTIVIKRDSSGKTVFMLKESSSVITTQDKMFLSIIFDLGKLEQAGKTIYGYPGEIQVSGKTWMPDLELFRSQLPGVNIRPKKLDGSVTLNKRQAFDGIDCLSLSMNIDCEIDDSEKITGVWHVVFPVNNTIYGPVKKYMRILRQRHLKLPEASPLTARQIIHSEETFRIETILLPVKFAK